MLNKLKKEFFINNIPFLLILLLNITINATEYTIPNDVYSVCANDIDLDGDNDIVVGHKTTWGNYNPTITILTNDGSGIFTVVDTSITFCGGQKNIFTQNIDEDNYPDIVTLMADFSSGEADRYVRIFYNELGFFEVFEDFTLNTVEVLSEITYGDLDNDNDLDICVVSNHGQFWKVLYNDGWGQFSLPELHSLDYHPGDIACGDLNNDGRDEIVVCGTTLDIYWNTENGFIYQLLADANYQNNLAISDIDNDGLKDIIVHDFGSPSSSHYLQIYRNMGDENFQLEYEDNIYLGLKEIIVSDLNNDNLKDIIYLRDGYADGFIIRFNLDGSTFSEEISYVTNDNCYNSFSADLDGNGFNDIITIHRFCLSDNLQILFNDGNGNFVEEPQVENSNYELQITNYELRNYPNPFNPITTISYSLPDNIENSLIEIFNIKGERIRELKIDNVKYKINSVVWDGKDHYHNPVSSGVYLYRIKSDEGVLISKKMLLLR